MLAAYIPILIMGLLVIAFAVGSLVITHVFGPRKASAEKLSVYESGVPAFGDARSSFAIRYSLVAMLFLIFDVEVVFLYAWAAVYRRMLSVGAAVLVEMIVFLAILLVGYVYVLKKKGFEWD